MSETNIVALHDHIPQQQQRISLVPHSSFARGRPRLNNRAFQKGRRRRTKSEDFFFSHVISIRNRPKKTVQIL
jgi:alpha-D-ribose 1-methylphosphonate 5-triphosphate diphosphatase PhnM